MIFSLNKKRLHLTRFLYPIITFVGIIILGEFLLYFFNDNIKKKENNSLNTASFAIAQNIQQKIAVAISSTNAIESVLRLNNFKPDNFKVWAEQIIKSSPHINNIQLAPNGIIEHIYPIKDNEGAIGHNLFEDSKRREGAVKALESNDIIFVGPLKLIQNNKLAIIARKPIGKIENSKKIFWGFITVVIYIEELTEDISHVFDESKFVYKLYGESPDFPSSNVIFESKNKIDNSKVGYPIKVPNGKWYLVIDYIHEYSFSKYLFHINIFLLSLFASVIIFFFENRSFKQNKKLKELNDSLNKMANTDILTQLSNRRSALKFIEKQLALCKRENKDFSLVFLDIDHFKKINDTYGHEIGDLALKHFSRLSENSIRKSDLLARWGGEEFLLILPMTDEKGAYTLCENIRKTIYNSSLKVDSNIINMSVSIGLTSLKQNKENINELLLQVDKAVYEAKDKGRNQTVVFT